MSESIPITNKHDHDLDDKLHPGCPGCDLIISLQPRVAREKKADNAAANYARIADKAKTSDGKRKGARDNDAPSSGSDRDGGDSRPRIVL